MYCQYCEQYLGESYYDGYHICPDALPTNWGSIIRWILFLMAILAVVAEKHC
jgi:hypothetical protein